MQKIEVPRLDKVKHLKVHKENAQKLILKLRKSGEMLNQYTISNEGDFIFIPVTGNFQNESCVYLEKTPREPKVMPQGHAGSFDLIGEIAIIHERKGMDTEFIADFINRSKKNVKSIYVDKGIYGEMRLRDLQLYRGIDQPVTLYRENNLIMKVDVKKVYFSPRLSTERYLLSKNVKDGESIFDMFCGLGPFSLNIAKTKKCNVVSCDINRDATELLKENISMNKLQSEVKVYNENSYELLKTLNPFDRIIMNNPVSKYESFDPVIKKIVSGGHLNVYFVADQEEIENYMESFIEKNMTLESKRVVHGYSRKMSMYSLQYRKG
jgi:tRNA (guanine37-N1)-methyltransferase